MASKVKYFVLVFTDNGPVYVTSVSNLYKIAYWERKEEPMAFTKVVAEDLVLGLQVNGTSCVMVSAKYNVGQPYNYDFGDFKWEWRKEEEE